MTSSNIDPENRKARDLLRDKELVPPVPPGERTITRLFARSFRRPVGSSARLWKKFGVEDPFAIPNDHRTEYRTVYVADRFVRIDQADKVKPKTPEEIRRDQLGSQQRAQARSDELKKPAQTPAPSRSLTPSATRTPPAPKPKPPTRPPPKEVERPPPTPPPSVSASGRIRTTIAAQSRRPPSSNDSLPIPASTIPESKPIPPFLGESRSAPATPPSSAVASKPAVATPLSSATASKPAPSPAVADSSSTAAAHKVIPKPATTEASLRPSASGQPAPRATTLKDLPPGSEVPLPEVPFKLPPGAINVPSPAQVVPLRKPTRTEEPAPELPTTRMSQAPVNRTPPSNAGMDDLFGGGAQEGRVRIGPTRKKPSEGT